MLSTPGSKLNFTHQIGNSSIGIAGCQVWYYYYDVTPENVDKCREENKDIIKLPNDVPLGELKFEDFNQPTKILIRKLFFAHAKRALGRVRGKFNGIVGTPNAERTMDYDTLLSEGNSELESVSAEIKERLENLSTLKQLERMANEAEFLNKHLKYRPLGFYVK